MQVALNLFFVYLKPLSSGALYYSTIDGDVIRLAEKGAPQVERRPRAGI